MRRKMLKKTDRIPVPKKTKTVKAWANIQKGVPVEIVFTERPHKTHIPKFAERGYITITFVPCTITYTL